MRDMFWEKGKKVFVGMSGGVDSSVAALLLKRRGFDVYGGFIRGYNVDGCQDKDLEDAHSVAQHINIPFHVFDFEKEYKEQVVDYFINGYKKGITPNPDVLCNSAIKFGLFYDAAMSAGADYVATGHYARRKRQLTTHSPRSSYSGAGNLQLTTNIYEAKDNNKDQSYFLWQVPQERFEHILFPLGKLLKNEVRNIAREANLSVAEKKDSQGVCFLGKFDFDEFLKKYIPVKKGSIVDTTGKEVGEHNGVWFYTIGQGHGLINTAGKRFYVIEKNSEKNELVVAYEGDEKLYDKKVVLSGLNFLNNAFEEKFMKGNPLPVLARVRYRQPLEKAMLLKRGYEAVLEFEEKSKLFPASGQSAVFYSKKGQMLGGGVIK